MLSFSASTGLLKEMPISLVSIQRHITKHMYKYIRVRAEYRFLITFQFLGIWVAVSLYLLFSIFLPFASKMELFQLISSGRLEHLIAPR